MTDGPAELWIRLVDGRSIRECYNQREMAEFMREMMLERLSCGKTLHCYDGESFDVPADSVKRIDFVLGHPT